MISGTARWSSRTHRTAPVSKSMSYTSHRCSPLAGTDPLCSPGSYRPGIGCTSSSAALTAVVTKMWSPQTMGELQLRPGMSIFQAMFSVSLHRSGRAGSSATAPAAGPRNPGHWAGWAAAGAASPATRAGTRTKPVSRIPRMESS